MPCTLIAWLNEQNVRNAERIANGYIQSGGMDHLDAFIPWWEKKQAEDKRRQQAAEERRQRQAQRRRDAALARRRAEAERALEERRTQAASWWEQLYPTTPSPNQLEHKGVHTRMMEAAEHLFESLAHRRDEAKENQRVVAWEVVYDKDTNTK